MEYPLGLRGQSHFSDMSREPLANPPEKAFNMSEFSALFPHLLVEMRMRVRDRNASTRYRSRVVLQPGVSLASLSAVAPTNYGDGPSGVRFWAYAFGHASVRDRSKTVITWLLPHAATAQR
jgi:hypothetical protein